MLQLRDLKQLSQHGCSENVVTRSDAINRKPQSTNGQRVRELYDHTIDACTRRQSELEGRTRLFHVLAELPRQNLRHQSPENCACHGGQHERAENLVWNCALAKSCAASVNKRRHSWSSKHTCKISYQHPSNSGELPNGARRHEANNFASNFNPRTVLCHFNSGFRLHAWGRFLRNSSSVAEFRWDQRNPVSS